MRDTRLRDMVRYTRSQIRGGLQGQEVTDLEQRIGIEPRGPAEAARRCGVVRRQLAP